MKANGSEVSSRRLTGVRVVLGLSAFMFGAYAVVQVLFPRQMLDMFGLSEEPLTKILQALLGSAGGLTLGWAIAFVMAMRDPLRSRALVQALQVGLVVMGSIFVYFDLGVLGRADAAASDLLMVVLGVFLFLLYPRRGTS